METLCARGFSFGNLPLLLVACEIELYFNILHPEKGLKVQFAHLVLLHEAFEFRLEPRISIKNRTIDGVLDRRKGQRRDMVFERWGKGHRAREEGMLYSSSASIVDLREPAPVDELC